MGFLTENPLYLLLLVIVVGCAVGIFVWQKFGSALSNRLKGPEKAPTLILGKSPEVESTNLLVDNVFYLSNDKTEEAWAFHPDALQYFAGGSVAGLVITHDTCLPQFPIGIDMKKMYESFKAIVRPVTLSQFHKAVETEMVKNVNSAMAEWLGFAALVAVGGVLVVVLFIMVKSYWF
jgi:hypothetical protein